MIRLVGVITTHLFALLLCSCRQTSTLQLPPDWPLKDLGLPAGSRVFEGRAAEHITLEDGSEARKWTAHFHCDLDFAAAREQVERQLRPLGFLIQDQPVQARPVGAGPVTFSQAYVSADGTFLVVLLYEQSAQAEAATGRPDYFTLMVQVHAVPHPPGEGWVEL